MPLTTISDLRMAVRSAAVFVEGPYDPSVPVNVGGIVTLELSAVVDDGQERQEGRLRRIEALLADEVRRRLGDYERLRRELDILRDERRGEPEGSCVGFRTEEIMGGT